MLSLAISQPLGTPLDRDITIYQGTTFKVLLAIKDSDGLPVDITSYTFEGMGRRKVTDLAESFEFDFTILNQTTNRGQVEMELTPADSSAVAVTDFRTIFLYDVEVDDGSDVSRILQGRVEFVAEVTK
jgi:hypothetical protein